VVPENSWEVLSLLATCRKEKQGGMKEEREDIWGLGCVSFSLYFINSYFENEIS
jgi:hypothetical protein